MAESYGLNFNLAMTTNEDGVVDLGVHVTDSDGLDLDRKASGKDAMKVIDELTSTLTRELRMQRLFAQAVLPMSLFLTKILPVC